MLVSCGDIGLPGVPDTDHARMCTGCAVTVRREEHGEPICRIPVETCTTEKGFTRKLPDGLSEKEALHFSVEGKDGTFDFVSFDLK